MKVKRFEELVCWKAARSLVKMIYNIVKKSGKFNKDFRLVGQATSSAVSVMSNIAEGFSRHSNKDVLVKSL
jgi:four helix bundle protein